MQKISFIQRLKYDAQGATVMEFGIVAGPLILLLLGIMDLGYQGYLDTVAKSKMHQVARQSSVGGMSIPAIETAIQEGLDPLLLDGARVDVTVKSFFDFTNIGKPEILSNDVNGDGDLDSGDCYLDGNNNGVFDTDFGVSGTGGPDDIVSYEIEISAPRFFPLATLFGGSDRIVSYNATAVRNQPFGTRVEIVELCEP